MSLRFWKRKLFIIFLLFILIFVLYLNQKRVNKSLNINKRLINEVLESESLLSRLSTSETNLLDIEDVFDAKLVELSELKKCGICLGLEFCQTFVTNLLVLTTSYVLNGLTYRKAVIKNTNSKLTLMSQSVDNWSQLEANVCLNSSQSVSFCNTTQAILNSFMSKSNLFLIENFREFFRYYNRLNNRNNYLQSTFSQCATKRYLQLLQNSFDTNSDHYLDLSEQSHLLSALLAFPAYLNHKLIQTVDSDLQVVHIKGVCGRIVVFDGSYQTLEEFTRGEKSFEVMAGLGVQIIQLVDDLQDEDPNWYFLHTELTTDSLLVNREGEVVLADLNDMVVIDKSLFDEHAVRSESLLNSQVCNQKCFESFHNKFVNALNTTSNRPSLECGHIRKHYGQHMYAMICKNIFSSEDSNRTTRFDLLRLVPNKDKENVEDLLRECIYETSPGGRKQAVDELRDLLRSYLRFDENENIEQNDNNNEDNDDEDNDTHNHINAKDNSNVHKN